MSVAWRWIKVSPNRLESSGDLGKIFRHSAKRVPGAFSLDAPTATATRLAREVIQNSWDAARELGKKMEGAPPFEMTFEFKKLAGQDKQNLVEAAKLSAHQTRLKSIKGGGGSVGLGPEGENCLDDLLNPEVPLRILVIKEKGTTGMYGSWENLKSLMHQALLSSGFSHKIVGGGSYGYGKAGLILSSHIKTIVAYSCFREEPGDPRITRRLLGVTYWGDHEIGDDRHTGIGTLSAAPGDDTITPFVNVAADEVATAMGLPKRSPEEPTDLGTTFLVIASPLEASDLKSAIERSWWPALVEGSFVVGISDENGEKFTPRPKSDPILKPFIKAWDIAKGRGSVGDDDCRAEPKASKKIKKECGCPTIGQVGLVADLKGWSYSQDEPGLQHKSMVALTRGPEMVVQYLADFRHRAPYVRGVYIADPSLDGVLRNAEPPLHDEWLTKAEHNFTENHAGLVTTVLKEIRDVVIKHHKDLRPPVPSADNVNLPHFNAAMRKLMSGTGKGGREPVPDTRPIAITLRKNQLSHHGTDVITVEGGATYRLSEHYKGESAEVALSLVYYFLDDARKGVRVAGRIKENPDGFSEYQPGVFKGKLSRDQTVDLDFISAPYNAAWSLRQAVNGKILPPKQDDS